MFTRAICQQQVSFQFAINYAYYNNIYKKYSVYQEHAVDRTFWSFIPSSYNWMNPFHFGVWGVA